MRPRDPQLRRQPRRARATAQRRIEESAKMPVCVTSCPAGGEAAGAHPSVPHGGGPHAHHHPHRPFFRCGGRAAAAGKSTETAPDGEPFNVTVLSNASGLELRFMDWGATWLSASVPLLEGRREVLLHYGASPAGWLAQSACMGAVVGRYAGRIAGATVRENVFRQNPQLDLVPSQGKNTLHGGPDNFVKRRWHVVASGANFVEYEISSPDGDQGFPGNCTVRVRYELTSESRLVFTTTANCDKLCPVAITNHAYFNLDGCNASQPTGSVLDHTLLLRADRFLPVSSEGLPTEEGIVSVQGTSFDFRQGKVIRKDFLSDEYQKRTGGYDHPFLLNADVRTNVKTLPAAELKSSDGRVTMKLYTNAPAVTVYAGNYLHEEPAAAPTAVSKGEQAPRENCNAGIAIEPGFLADSPNHPEWPQDPSVWVQPFQEQKFTSAYEFQWA